MTSHRSNLLAAVYREEAHARTIVATLEQMHRAASITLDDAALITRDPDGKLHVHETSDMTAGQGAARGAAIGGLIGLVFPPSILVAGAVGAAIGGALAGLHDAGIANDQLRALGERLGPGEAMVVALVDEDSVVAVRSALEGYDGELVVSPVSEETMKAVFEAGGDVSSPPGVEPDDVPEPRPGSLA